MLHCGEDEQEGGSVKGADLGYKNGTTLRNRPFREPQSLKGRQNRFRCQVFGIPRNVRTEGEDSTTLRRE